MEILVLLKGGRLAVAGILTNKPLNYRRYAERIATSFGTHDQPQTLVMVVYQPIDLGPFLTIVMNHGSTGLGNSPERFKYVWTSVPLGRYFVDRGWQVLFPQRRGRGGSDGEYEEGFAANGSG